MDETRYSEEYDIIYIYQNGNLLHEVKGKLIDENGVCTIKDSINGEYTFSSNDFSYIIRRSTITIPQYLHR